VVDSLKALDPDGRLEKRTTDLTRARLDVRFYAQSELRRSRMEKPLEILFPKAQQNTPVWTLNFMCEK
jgi:hypothetical protein